MKKLRFFAIFLCLCLLLGVVSASAAPLLPYAIKVNRAWNTVTVYTHDENGQYTVPVKAMICSTARKGYVTPLGQYRLEQRRSEWRLMLDGTYGQYATQFYGNYLFHSICYEDDRHDAMKRDSYNNLGNAASMGCVRLETQDAKWIFDNCPAGTPVTIYEDYDSPGPLGKPNKTVTYIPTEVHNGWDPTDPAEGNPWRTAEVSEMELSAAELTLQAGEAAVLTETHEPELALVFWKSSDEAVATAENGRVTALSAGEATITVAGLKGLSAQCTVTVEGDEPIVPRDAATSEELARKNLSKTGGTPYFLSELIYHNEAGLMLPPSAQNALRRAALEGLSALRRRVEPWEFDPAPVKLPQRVSHKRQGIWLRAMHPEQLDFDEEAEKILLPGELLTPELVEKYGDRLIATLPEVNFEADSARLTAILEKLKGLGVGDVEVWNIGMLHAAKAAGFRIHGGAGLNIYNSLALAEYQRLGLVDGVISFELSARDIEKLGGTIPRGIMGYGRLPMMRLRACPGKGPKGCGKCQGQTILTDRIGAEFPVACDGRRYSTLYNTLPLYVGDKEPGGIDYAVLSFTFESAAEAEKIYRKYLGGFPPRVERTRGLYYRETK